MLSFTNFLVIVFTYAIPLAILLLGIFRSYGIKRRSNFPPGDMSLPFVGSGLSFLKPHPCTCLGDYMEKYLSKYGKISSINFFGEMMVVSADPDLNHFVLQNEMRLFKNRAPSDKLHNLMGESSLLLLTGAPYRHRKSILLNFFGKFKTQTSFIESIEELAAKIVSSWKHKNVLYVADETNKFSFSIVAKKVMGLVVDKLETEQLRRDFMTIYQGIAALPINFPGTSYSKAMKARATIVKTIKQKIEDRKMGKNREMEKDLLDCLIKETSYTWENICDTLQGFIFAGLVTTSTAISLAIYFLHSSPKALEKMRFSFSIVAKKVMGLVVDKLETEQLRRDFMTIYQGIAALPINFPGTSYSKAMKARATIVKTIKQKIEDRKMGKNREMEEDLLDCLIKETSYTWENICDTLQGFIFAGQVTASTAISLAIYFLHSSPKALEKMRDEHLRVIRSKKQDGLEKLTWDDYKNMEFTQYVINETLRLGNVAPVLRKTALKDIEYKGYVIPEGTTVMVHLSAVHLDPSLFENPEQFNPWRWQNAKKSSNLSPFGGGVRHCNGWELARIEIAVFLHHLILNYNWEVVEPDHPISFPQVKFPKGQPVRVQPLEHAIMQTL